MTAWLAGMRITADRLNNGIDATLLTTGVTDSAGWSTTEFMGRRSGKIVTIETVSNRTGASITEVATNTGNIGDVSVLTLPAGWWPPHIISAMSSNGSTDGECSISVAGVVTLRTTSGNLGFANGSNLRMSATWIDV